MNLNHSIDKKLKFTKEILNWWDINRRDFPWRKTKDPYITLITEILLRKTTSGHVNSIRIGRKISINSNNWSLGVDSCSYTPSPTLVRVLFSMRSP